MTAAIRKNIRRVSRELAGRGWPLLLILYFVVYLLPLGIRPLAEPDETRYAEVPREMLVTGDFLVPRLNGLRYFEKPPLGYWLNAASIAAFGENSFAVRLPSALAAGITALFIWLLLQHSGYTRKQCMAAAATYLATVEVLFVGTFAVLDTLLAATLTGGIVFFYLAADTEDRRKRGLHFFASGLLFGLAFLNKGFLALVVPGIVLLPWMVLSRRLLLLQYLPLIILGCALPVLPWAIALHLREPDFWRYFFWEEHVRRFLADNAQHAAPDWYYLAYLPVLLFPWFAMLPAAVAGLRRGPRTPLSWLLLLWAVMPFLFFSASKGKLATYILPCYAPLIVLLVTGIGHYLQQGNCRLLRAGAAFNALLCGIVLAGFAWWLNAEPRHRLFYQRDEQGLAWLSLLLITLAMLCTIAAALRRLPDRWRMTMTGVAVLPLFAVWNFSLPSALQDNRAPETFFRNVSHRISADTVLISQGKIVRGVNWAFKRSDVYMLSANELHYGLSYTDSRHRLLQTRQLRVFIEEQRVAGHDVALLCRPDCGDKVAKQLPDDAVHYTNGFFSLWLVSVQHSNG